MSPESWAVGVVADHLSRRLVHHAIEVERAAVSLEALGHSREQAESMLREDAERATRTAGRWKPNDTVRREAAKGV